MLALIAEGKTDRGISDELVVKRKAVEAHVRSILGKLDIPTDANENRHLHAVLASLCAGGAARVSKPGRRGKRSWLATHLQGGEL